MTADSTCGAKLKDEKGSRKHKRLHCKLRDPNISNLKCSCPDCGLEFESKIGMSQQRRHTHQANYNRDNEASDLATRKKRTLSTA